MNFIFDDFTEKTEALVTAVNVINEEFGIYELTVFGLDKDKECGYTNKGIVTINDNELKPLLESKSLSFPTGIIGQKVRLISDEEIRKEQAHNTFFNELLNDVEELDID